MQTSKSPNFPPLLAVQSTLKFEYQSLNCSNRSNPMALSQVNLDQHFHRDDKDLESLDSPQKSNHVVRHSVVDKLSSHSHWSMNSHTSKCCCKQCNPILPCCTTAFRSQVDARDPLSFEWSDALCWDWESFFFFIFGLNLWGVRTILGWCNTFRWFWCLHLLIHWTICLCIHLLCSKCQSIVVLKVIEEFFSEILLKSTGRGGKN